MSLANPLALWLLLLVPIPLLLSKRRVARRHDVSNLYLWTTAADPEASLKPKSLRRDWIVFLQMAVLAAMALAIAKPAIALHGERVAFVFDMSASMLARDGRTTRFGEAVARARATLAGLPRRSRVQVIAAGTAARDLGEYAVTDRALVSAIDRLHPAPEAADIGGAVAIAATSKPADRVIVFSDRSTDVPETNRRVFLQWEIVGAPADNLSISTFVARRRPLTPSDADVLLAVRNFGTRRARADIETLQDGKVIDRRVLDVAPNRDESFVLRIGGVGRVLTARLKNDDALPIDDERYEIVPPFERIRVAVADRPNAFVEKALAADSGLLVGGTPDAADVVVCSCDRVPPAGNVLRVPPNGNTDVRALTDDDVIVSAGAHAAFIASQREGRRVVELRFVPTDETAINTTFPLLVANAIRWLDGRGENATQVLAGEPLQWRMRRLGGTVSVTGPDGKPRAAQVVGERVAVVDTAETGVYTVRTGAAEQLFAVNPVVDGESDLQTAGGVRPGVDTESRRTSSSDVGLTRALLVTAALLMLLEWAATRQRTAWRVAVAACLFAAAAGLAMIPLAAPADVVAVFDRSRSVPVRAQREASDRVSTAAASLRRGDRLGIVDFGAEALVRSELSESRSMREGVPAVADGDTDIRAGLRLARAMLPSQGPRRIVLFSDGRQTVGDAERESTILASEGIRVDVAGVTPSAASSASALDRVSAPASVRRNEPFDIGVEISGAADANARLTIYRDDRVLASEDVHIGSGGRATATLTDKEMPGVHVYRAVLKTEDSEDERGAVVSVVGAPTVLYVSTSTGTLEPVLTAAGFQITRVTPAGMPRGVDALQRYDAVVLDDVSADEIGEAAASDTAAYVEQFGGGLLLLGGARTLDIAGYPTGPLGSSLPIDFRLRSGQRAPAFGLVIVFDKSGSMADQAGGASKIELARQAVARVVDVLPPTDSLGVVAFDAKPVVVSRLGAGQRAADVANALQTVLPGGATRIAPAVTLAVQWLNDPAMRSTMSKRRVLLISDGQTTLDDERQLRAAVAAGGVEVSAVAVGNDTNRRLLEQLASSTGGRAYFPSDLSELPKIVAREAVRSRSGHIVEEPFTIRSTPHAILAGIDRTSLPQLSGYVVGAAKPSAASVLASHLDDPVLSAWQFGLGRVAVFTADLRSSWSASLRAWRSFGRLWVQTARWVSRAVDDRDLRLRAERDGKALRLVVDGEREDGSVVDFSEARATVRSPDRKTADVTFDPSAPGRYVARVDATASGEYDIAFTGRERDGNERHLTTAVFRNPDQERVAGPADDELLRRLAAITGGRVLTPSDNPFAFPRPRALRDVTTWVVTIALAAYLALVLTVFRRTPSARSAERV